jgi:class 3 adenylate cyclase
VKPSTKIYIFMAGQGLLFNVAACIYTWPACLTRSPLILLYVNGMNVAYFVAIWNVLCPPRKIFINCFVIFVISVWCPLFYVAYRTGNQSVFMTVIADSITASLTSVAWSFMAGRVFRELEVLRASKEIQASKFLGDSIHAAIFDDRKELLKEETCSGFILFLDIRDSSKLANDFHEQWEILSKDWIKEATRLVPLHNGHILKTGGDSLLITFGIFGEQIDLSDIPGIAEEVDLAEKRRWGQLGADCFGCTDALIKSFQSLAEKYFSNVNVRLGAGVDRGSVKRGVRGGDHRLELDIWGPPVNLASRLEGYSKIVGNLFAHTSSLLVVSPDAAEYIPHSESFVKHLIKEDQPVKDFYEIKWILIKEYAHTGEVLTKLAV